MKKVILSGLLIFSLTVVYSQRTEMNFQDELEDLLENSLAEDETKDVEQLLNELQNIKEHPFNINTADYSDFAALYFLNQVQINALLDYKKNYGQILSVYELTAIDGFDMQLAQLLNEFVVFDQAEVDNRSNFVRHEVLIRGIRIMEKQAGYLEPKKFEGSPEKLYMRYRFSTASVLAGFTGEKDAGESFFHASNKSGFDYYSGFTRVEFGRNKSSFVLGDYVVQLGQGLAAWQGFSLGKSVEVTQVAKFNQGIKPYSSTDENNFMRGAAANLNLGRFQLHSFYSSKKFDANTDSIDGMNMFTSFQTSGLHRTAGEIEDKNSVFSMTTGGNLNFSGKNYSVGMTGIHIRYQYPLDRRADLYNRFLFEGDQYSNMSIDYQWSINRLYFFGEMASNFNKGFAVLNGAMFQPVDLVEFSVVTRNIGKKYNAPLGSAFTENSRVNDEQGIYLGGRISPMAKVSLYLYADFFSYKWIKYTTAAPGKGREYLLQANYNPSGDWQLFVRYFYECKPVKITGSLMKENLNQLRQSVRLQLTGKIKRDITVKSRIEHSFYKHDHESTGMFISQDIGYLPLRFPLHIWGRVAYFNTGDYDSRIYSYENDLLYQFSIPAFYGEGVRSYLTGKVKICEKAELWFKVSRSWFLGVDSLGDSYSLIEGNKRTELKLQLRFRI